jgi:transcriptional regulator with XRE-family HTH domain
LQSLLQAELTKRRERNARYSLRSFARDLGLDHSTLSQVLRGERRFPASRIAATGRRLGLNAEEIAAWKAAASAPDASTSERMEQLRNWSAEALAIFGEPHHHELLQACHESSFQPDSRWLAAQLGVTVDAVNVAAARLARLGLLEMTGASHWRDVQGLGRQSSAAFRRAALERIRQLAPMFPKLKRRIAQ